MATWQQGINSGGFLAGIGTQNENAPKASDINATLGLIRENNELARSGANNVGLTALRGLAGVADIYNQEQQQKAISAFNKVHADAWASGDPSGLFKFAQENPAFVAQAQQAFSGLNEQQRNDMGDLAMRANVALYQGPEAYSKFITDNKDRLNRVGANADWMIQTGIQNPEQLSHMLTTMSLGALGPEKAFAVQDKMVGREIDRGQLAETIRSNKAGEALTARGQNITMRGQDLSMQRASMKGSVGNNERTVQLADGRTVTVGGKLHGAGANAFYEGIDNEGNMVRVPAGSIAAPATSAASAQNYAMKKDLDAISGASIDDLGFMTGITGSSGSPALGADIRSRASGGDQRKLYNAAQRIKERCRIRALQQPETWGHPVSTPLQKQRCIFKVCHRLISQALKHCNNQCETFSNIPTITTNNITLMLVNLSGSNLNLHRYHSQQPAVTFLHYGVING
ncbi:DNA transfer protein [Escherichia coli]|uniref:DNA transfer protein n=1 Tax=Escherichia coli TaxID=562 RepID=UPI00351CDB17